LLEGIVVKRVVKRGSLKIHNLKARALPPSLRFSAFHASVIDGLEGFPEPIREERP
jgi:hypothetical protein